MEEVIKLFKQQLTRILEGEEEEEEKEVILILVITWVLTLAY
jgi:hypothetical protein